MSPSSSTDSPFFSQQDKHRPVPDFSLESRLAEKGAHLIAGIDEAGRGPLAGPVVAAAVILDSRNIPDGLNDSKKLSASARQELFVDIVQSSQIAWYAVNSTNIDRLNILQATLLAMARAANFLSATPDAILIDGRDVPVELHEVARSIIGGDGISQSIAAASIIAKVVRDRMMIRADMEFPGYGFAKNKGYGTKLHRDAIHEIGPCEIHRRSFAPISTLNGQQDDTKKALFAVNNA